MPTLDLNALPLFRQEGQDRNDLPGLYMAIPPRRAGRGREADRLILYFAMLGNPSLPADQIEPLLTRAAQVYYKTPGSITSAMRSAADRLNMILLERNLRSSSTEGQSVGVLVIGVLREDRLILSHGGPAHTFVITAQETQHLHDPQGSRGLGMTRAVSLRYYQLDLHPNDLLVIASQPPPAWTTLTLQSVQSLGIETLRRRLLGHAGPELSAVLFQAQVGAGKLRMLRPKAPVQMATPSAGESGQAGDTEPPADAGQAGSAGEEMESGPQAPAAPEAENPPESSSTGGPRPGGAPMGNPPETALLEDRLPSTQPAAPAREITGVQAEDARFAPGVSPNEPALERSLEEAGFEPIQRAEDPQAGKITLSPPPRAAGMQEPAAPPRIERRLSSRPAREEAAAPVAEQGAVPPAKAAPASEAPSTQPGQRRSLPRLSIAPLLHIFAPVGRGLGRFLRRLAGGLHLFLKRMLPDESLFHIPASTMIFMAVAVAVIISAAGGAVYFQRGVEIQYQANMDQALQAAQLAGGQTDPQELRTAWETALDFVDQAETFQVTEASKELRRQGQSALDGLDYIQRVDFQPMIPGGLGSQVRVSRMVATEGDIYLLNSNGGSVLRAVRTGRGYELDSLFECGPNPQIGPLVDITAIPKDNEFGATLLAMDERGNLLYCIPGDKPVARFPNIPQPTDQGMRAFALDSGTLYVLDPGNNAVWYYRNMEIDQPPHTYFGPDRPDDVQGIIDMAVNRDDLFLLHKDGYIIRCIFGGLQESPTRCEDPAILSDPRPGRSKGPVILDARFDQILFTPPPDPSLYLLDPVNGSIYHFGLRLTFQRQVRPASPLPSTSVTAFAITQNRTVFLVAGSQLYSALLP